VPPNAPIHTANRITTGKQQQQLVPAHPQSVAWKHLFCILDGLSNSYIHPSLAPISPHATPFDYTTPPLANTTCHTDGWLAFLPLFFFFSSCLFDCYTFFSQLVTEDAGGGRRRGLEEKLFGLDFTTPPGRH
jgi:hypothetical protein